MHIESNIDISYPRKLQDNSVLVFVHLPKTAGTTFHNILQKQFKDKVHYCAYNNGFKQLNGLRRMSQADVDKIDIVRGHINYGIHKYFSRPCEYITFFREPVSRIVSHYLYVQSNIFHPLHRLYEREEFSIRDFLNKTTDNDNGQVRALCGLSNTLSMFEGPRLPFGEVDSTHLEQAKKTLATFAAFGIQERFDESLLLMKERLGLDIPLYKSTNVNEINTKGLISQDDIKYIREFNRFDIELYSYACKLFDNQINSRPVQIDFELKYFKSLIVLNDENSKLKDKIKELTLNIDMDRELRYLDDKVSVIIPTYNRAHLVVESIQSVLAQTYTNLEIIVVDDGSTDATEKVIAAISDTRLRYIRQPNRGRSNARNHALSLTHGKYITFLDSDDLYLPNKIELQVAYLKSHLGVGAVYTSAHCINDHGEMLAHKYLASVSGLIYESIAFFTPVTITLPTVMTYKSIMDHVGGFDENLHRFEDTDMWRRISKSYRIDAMHEYTCLLRTHDDNSLLNQNPDEITLALECYAAKILKEDLEINISLRRKGLARLYKYYGHAFMSVAQFSDAGKSLLRTANKYESFLDRNYFAKLARHIYYRVGWSGRFVYYRSANIFYRIFSKVRSFLKKS